MGYDPSDSSGTDDDLPPSHQNRVSRGSRITGNGRTAALGAPHFSDMHNDMEAQIHHLEQEAYSLVLRAFKAQADVITWEKESLITELRQELRVSLEEHRELISRVNSDDTIRRIREWRQAGAPPSGFLGATQPVHDTIPSPTVSASRKKQKTSHSVPSLSLGAPSPALQQQTFNAPMQRSPSVVKRGAMPGSRVKRPKSSSQYGRGSAANRDASGALSAIQPAEAATFDPLIGRKVISRWPEDNYFYEAVITDYNALTGRHALVYDINTANETWEWVDLKEISPEDIQWEGEDPGIFLRTGNGGLGHGTKMTIGRSSAAMGARRGRGGPKNPTKKEFALSQNVIGKKKGSDDIEILHTDTLIKEVERVFGSSHPDPLEIEKAKKMLKEHEQSLVDIIARLADASDGESEDGDRPFVHGQSMDQDDGWKI